MAEIAGRPAEVVHDEPAALRRRAAARGRLAQSALWAFIVLGLLLTVLPGVWMVLSSFKTRAEIVAVPLQLLPQALLWENYEQAIKWMRFERVFFNSLLITSAITVANVFTCTWGGYTFGKLRWPGRDRVFLVLLSTMMIPGFLTLIPRYVLTSQLGMLNTYPGMIVPFLTGTFGIFLTKQYMLGIPDEVVDAAKVDGASALAIYWRIILPLCKPIVAVLAIFVFDWAWDDLLWGTIILTDRDMWTLPVAISNIRMQAGALIELQMAASALAIGPVIVLFAFLQQHIVRGVALSGLKG